MRLDEHEGGHAAGSREGEQHTMAATVQGHLCCSSNKQSNIVLSGECGEGAMSRKEGMQQAAGRESSMQ